MNNQKHEQRLIEAFAQYESGVSLATLQTIFSDVAVELNQMVEAEQLLRARRGALKPSQELGRKIVAGLSEQQRRNASSVFMSGLWRLVAPVGVAALSFMVILSVQHTSQLAPITDEGADLFVMQEVAPMAATKMPAPVLEETATMSLMANAPTESDAMAQDARMAEADSAEMALSESSDSLYWWQMISLGLLVLFSLVVLYKHWLVRRQSLV